MIHAVIGKSLFSYIRLVIPISNGWQWQRRGYTRVNAFANTNTYGLEFEGAIYPIEWFDVSATATLQKGAYQGLVAKAVTGGTLTQKYNYNGNQTVRVPVASIRVVPTGLYESRPGRPDQSHA